MTSLPIDAIAAVSLFHVPTAASSVASPPAQNFADILGKGIDAVNTKVADAENLSRAFALDDSIPVHQVTYALTQAQLSLELMTHVRDRLIDGYQQLMNMQI